MTARPSPGDLLTIDGRASVQFAEDRALTFRVVSVSNQSTYDGWIWLTGYVLNRRGQAAAKREVYVQLAGLQRRVTPTSQQPNVVRLAPTAFTRVVWRVVESASRVVGHDGSYEARHDSGT